jgi:hypothetical protein
MSRVSLVLAVLGLGSGCSPDTDLRARGPRAPDPGAGANMQALVTLVEPTPGAIAPRNLAAVVLRLPSALAAGGAVHLRGEGGAVALGMATPVECSGAGRCYGFPVAAPVAPGRYQVDGPAGAIFDDGRPVPAAAAGAFDVEAELDRAPPVVDPPLIETVGDCLRARFATDEPVRAALVVRAGGLEQVLAAGEGSTLFDVAARLVRLPAGAPGELVARAVDWAGNRGESGILPVMVPPASTAIAITEVLPNPTGPEATQEFVELRNLGTSPVSLEGMLIEDATGADPLPAGTLEPGAFAVVVASGYDLMDGRDPAPRAGAMLLRVDGRIGRDGIGNASEAVRLRARSGEVLSRYGGWIDAGPTAWTGRSVQRLPQDACDGPAAWNPRPQQPTPGW